jgi:hypothetical protein
MPTTDAVILQRLEDAARSIPPHATAPRIAMADVAYPASKDESDHLGGYAVLFVTAVAQAMADLPVDRVEISREGNRAKLIKVGEHKSMLTVARLAEVFGSFRQDVVYLIPIAATQTSTLVTVFLGGGVYPLNVLRFPLPDDQGAPPPGVSWDGETRRPDPDALRAIVEREFPVVTGH